MGVRIDDVGACRPLREGRPDLVLVLAPCFLCFYFFLFPSPPFFLHFFIFPFPPPCFVCVLFNSKLKVFVMMSVCLA